MTPSKKFKPTPGKLKAALPRPRKAHEIQWPMFDTMAQCSAMSGVPMTILKQAKALGCPAFKHSRVYFHEFLQWLFTNLMDDKAIDWGKDLEKSKALRERIKLAEDENRVLDRNSIADGIAKAEGVIFSELDRIFVSELPSRGKGMAELDLRKLSTEEIERLKNQLRAKFESLKNGRKVGA